MRVPRYAIVHSLSVGRYAQNAGADTDTGKREREDEWTVQSQKRDKESFSTHLACRLIMCSCFKYRRFNIFSAFTVHYSL